MVSCGILVFLCVAALHQISFARQDIREPPVFCQVYSVLAHGVLSDLDAFSPQSISLTPGRTWAPLSLVNNEQQATKRAR